MEQRYTYTEFMNEYNELDEACKFIVLRVLNNLPTNASFSKKQLEKAYDYIRNYAVNEKKISLNHLYQDVARRLNLSPDAIRKTIERKTDNSEVMNELLSYLRIKDNEILYHDFLYNALVIPQQAIESPTWFFCLLAPHQKWLIKELIEDLSHIYEKIEYERYSNKE